MSILGDLNASAISLISGAAGQTLYYSTSPDGPWTQFTGYLKKSNADGEYSEDDMGNAVSETATLTTSESTQSFDRGHYIKEGSTVWAITAPSESGSQQVYPNVRRHTVDEYSRDNREYR